MMRQWRFLLWIILIAGTVNVMAQPGSCPAIVQDALNNVNEFCQQAGRNQACYGNIALTAEPKPGVSNFTFEQTGDIVDVSAIQSIQTAAMDGSGNTWGVALLKLQANIPDTMPGQNVTFLIFGDASLTDMSGDGQTPMQSFYLETGIGDSRCKEAPDSGILVQTPDGVQEVGFTMNGVEMRVGSTALLQARPGKEITVSALEGAARMRQGDRWYPAIRGTQFRIRTDDSGNAVGNPYVQPNRRRDVSGIPYNLLPRELEEDDFILDDDAYNDLQTRLNNGEPPCGTDLLPPCEDFGFYDDDEDIDWATDDDYEDDFPERFLDLGDARLDEDGYILLPDGDVCAPSFVDPGDSGIGYCDDLDVFPDDVYFPDDDDYDLFFDSLGGFDDDYGGYDDGDSYYGADDYADGGYDYDDDLDFDDYYDSYDDTDYDYDNYDDTGTYTDPGYDDTGYNYDSYDDPGYDDTGTYTDPDTGYDDTGTYTDPDTGYDDTGSYTDPATGYDDTGSGYDDTGSGYDDTGGSYDDTGSGYDDTGSGYDDTGSGYDDTGGSYDDTGGSYDDAGGGYDDTGGGYDDTGGYGDY